MVASQVKCIQDAVTRFSNPDLREPQYQHLPAGIPNVKVSVGRVLYRLPHKITHLSNSTYLQIGLFVLTGSTFCGEVIPLP